MPSKKKKNPEDPSTSNPVETAAATGPTNAAGTIRLDAESISAIASAFATAMKDTSTSSTSTAVNEASSKSSSQSRKRTGEPVSGSEFSDEDEEDDDVPLAVYGGKSSLKKSKVCPESQSATYLEGTVGTVPMPKGLHYFVPESVRKDILDNKLVHLHKLVPGYDAAFSGSQSLVSETDSSGVSRISLGSKTAEERLSLQGKKWMVSNCLQVLLRQKNVTISVSHCRIFACFLIIFIAEPTIANAHIAVTLAAENTR